MEYEVERLTRGETLLILTEAMDRDAVAGAREAAEKAPRPALHTIDLRIEVNVVPSLNDLLCA